jgi:phosphoglycolate phosphatase
MSSSRLSVLWKVKGIVFDKDGTLVDFLTLWAPSFWRGIWHLVLEYGDPAVVNKTSRLSMIEVTSRLCAHVGLLVELDAAGVDSIVDHTMPLVSYMKVVHPKCLFTVGTPAQIIEHIRACEPNVFPSFCVDSQVLADFLSKRVFELQCNQWTTFGVTPPAGKDTKSVLAWLHQHGGFHLGLASNDTMLNVLSCLRSMGICPQFIPEENIVAADCGFGRKPDPRMLRRFTELFHVQVDELCMVGDSVEDYDMSVDAGVAVFVGVLSGICDEATFRAHEKQRQEKTPDGSSTTQMFLIDHLCDLLSLFPQCSMTTSTPSLAST